jgi:site-specific recombinase XerC
LNQKPSDSGIPLPIRPNIIPLYASKLIEKGKDLKFIQHAMGHSKIEITLNVYGHLLKGRDEAHKGTAEELATEILGKKRPSHTAEIRVL